MKTTPGQWEANDKNARVYVAETDRCVARCAGDLFDPPTDECLANARLIASAPELAAALAEMVAEVGKVSAFGDSIGRETNKATLARVRNKARAVLVRAGWEESCEPSK